MELLLRWEGAFMLGLLLCAFHSGYQRCWVFHWRFSYVHTGHVHPCLNNQIHFTPSWWIENVPWLMGRLGGAVSVYLYIGEWNIHIARFSEQKLSRFSQCKWYLGLDFHSRLLLLRGKRQLLWAVIFLGGNLFLFHAARVLDQALNALKQKCFGPQPFTPSALFYVIE